MKIKKILDDVADNCRATIEVIEGEPGLHDYGISRTTWMRGIKFVNRFGAEKALHVIDHRAERAADRGDYDTSRRWRNLIVAIHAMQEDERLLGQEIH